MDFGFTNDVTAVVDVFMQNGELFLNERLYENNLTNSDIVDKLINSGHGKHKTIVADSSEPKSIEEIRRLGLNIEGALKGADSINISISNAKKYRLNITNHSTNLRKELLNYKWKVDKTTGNTLNEPIDAFNHALDAFRYVVLNKLITGPRKIKASN
jgi:phage terminase large subunit